MGYGCIDQNALTALVVAGSLASMLLGVGIGHMMAADYLRTRRLAKAPAGSGHDA